MKDNIYFSKDDLCEATEAYLIKTHLEFYRKFMKANWKAYYNENIHICVSFIFENFYKFILRLINTKFKSSSKVIK